MKRALNVVGPQVRRIRNKRNWTQSVLARKLQLQGWDVSVNSLGKLEAQLRRVPDCELMFLAKVLSVDLKELFPTRCSLRQLGPEFQSGGRLAIFPARGDR